MIKMKNIVVTTDLSVASYSAMDYAAWLAEKEKGTVTLLYCVDNLPQVAYHTVDLTFDKFRDEVLLFEKKRLEEFAARFQRNFNDVLSIVMTEGYAPHEIVKFANEQHADIIVMSTHGRTGIQHVVLGSVAERVVRTAHCPVLTVKSIIPKSAAGKKKSRKK